MAIKAGPPESTQTVQRLKVGVIGLALVLLLLGLASAIFNSRSKEEPVDVVGAPQADVIANLSVTNDSDSATPNEPLVALGVAPSGQASSNTMVVDNTTQADDVPPVAVPRQPAPQVAGPRQ